MIDLRDKIYVNRLLDFYENLLKDKSASYMNEYFRDDNTLAEIAENYGVSRQAVLDNIKRSTKQLNDFEDKLQLIKQFDSIHEIIDKTIMDIKRESNKQTIIDNLLKVEQIIER